MAAEASIAECSRHQPGRPAALRYRARTLHEEQGDRIALDQRAMAREATSVRCALVPTMAGNTNEPRWLREDSCGGMLGGPFASCD